MPNAICLVVDGLHAGFLGCYGNAWVQTPALDHLAIRGFLFDQAFVDSPRIGLLYRSFWEGFHAMVPADAVDVAAPLAERLAGHGVNTHLWSDESDVLRLSLAEGFGERRRFDSTPTIANASRVEETHSARTLASAVDGLADLEEPFCLWIHLRGLIGDWDAPLALRNQFVEEDEPEPGAFFEVPNLFLPEDFDPDDLLSIRRAYAGQVSLLDTCLAGFLRGLDESAAADRTLLTVVGLRSFPLGEHRRVGLADAALHEELVHVPWIIRLPDETGAADRSPSIVQPADLGVTLLDWFGAHDSTQPSWGSSLLGVVRGQVSGVREWTSVSGAAGEAAIRTPAWYLRRALGSEDQPTVELYAKPDDRWEINEVSDRCAEATEGLDRALTAFEEAAIANRPSELPLLDESLMCPER